MIQALVRAIVPPAFRPVRYLSDLVRRRTGGRIFGGPFAGTRYVEISPGADYIPKLLGTYERELHGALEEAIGLRFGYVVNIGAAEGLYAVGLALRMPMANVLAFEADEGVKRQLATMAAANGVGERLCIEGRCVPAALRARLPPSGSILVVCDTDGSEAQILDIEQIPRLSVAYILVELHEYVVPGVTRLLMSRFSATHAIQRLEPQPRGAAEFPFRTLYTRLLGKAYLARMVSDQRPEGQSWLWMRPKNG